MLSGRQPVGEGTRQNVVVGTAVAEVDVRRLLPGRRPRRLCWALLALLGPALVCALPIWESGGYTSRRGTGQPAPAVLKANPLGGKVVEADMATAMGGLSVTLRDKRTDRVAQATTGPDGHFFFEGLREGPHLLHVGVPGLEAHLTLVDDATDGDLQIVLLKVSTRGVPPGVPDELTPKPLPAAIVRRDGKVILVGSPPRTAAGGRALPRWSRTWIGRTTP